MSDSKGQGITSRLLQAPIRVLQQLYWGRYGLPKTFWLYYTLGSAAMFVLSLCIAGLLLIAGARPLAFLAFATLWLGYLALASVGVWRAASTYPYTRWWPNLAKLVVLAMSCRILWSLVNGGAQLFVTQVMQ